MQQIFKYPVIDGFPVRMPPHAPIVHVGLQDGRIMVWARVKPTDLIGYRNIYVVGTGWELEDDLGEHLGTVQTPGGLVWHVFDKGEVFKPPVPLAGT